jgi:iron complex outermembrane receptor protein
MRHPSLALLFALPFSIQLHAQVDSLRLDTVQVTATRIGSSLLRAGRQVQVLDSRVLQAAPAPELSALLRTHTVVDVRQRGPFDSQTDLSLRGGTFDQALVLLDGIPLSDPQTGHHAMNLPVAPEDLQRVEVLYGGAARTYGAGAFSGALNLITREPQRSGGRLQLEGGSFGSWRTRVAQEVAWKQGGLRLSAQHLRSDGHVRNSDLDLSAAHLSVVQRMKNVRLQAQLGLSHKRFGAQNFYSSLYPDQQEVTTMALGAVELRNDRSPWPWSARVYHRHHHDLFQLFRESEGYYRFDNGFFIRGEADTARFTPTFFYTFHNRHSTRVSGAELAVRRSWKAGTTALGVHGRAEGILSNVIGEPLATPEPRGTLRDPFTRSTDRNNLAVHLDHRWERDGFGIDAGVLLNLNDRFEPEWAPGIDLHRRWKDGQVTHISLSRSFRLPTWTDLYYNRGGAQGSPTLLPEHADQVELGHRIHRLRWQAAAAVWRRSSDDLIDWTRQPGDATVRATNLTRVDMNGVELLASMRWNEGKQQVGLAYAHQWTDQPKPTFTSLYVLDHLRHVGSVWAQVQVRDAWHLHVAANWRLRNGTWVDFDTRTERTHPSGPRVDMRVERRWKWIAVHVSALNLLDLEQMDRANVPLPGRWLGGGISLQWGA